MFALTQGWWRVHLERLHCDAASQCSHHLLAYRCSIVILCTRTPQSAACSPCEAGMAIQALSKHISADVLLVLESISPTCRSAFDMAYTDVSWRETAC